jgi:hypothetical protein
MLYDALLHLCHNGDVPVYRGRMSKAHGQDICEVSVTLPLSPTEPWGMTVISVELDETVKQAAHIALTTLCETRLDADCAVPDPRAGGAHVEAASSGCDRPRGSSLPHRHGCDDQVRTVHVQLAMEHRQDHRPVASADDLPRVVCRGIEA